MGAGDLSCGRLGKRDFKSYTRVMYTPAHGTAQWTPPACCPHHVVCAKKYKPKKSCVCSPLAGTDWGADNARFATLDSIFCSLCAPARPILLLAPRPGSPSVRHPPLGLLRAPRPAAVDLGGREGRFAVSAGWVGSSRRGLRDWGWGDVRGVTRFDEFCQCMLQYVEFFNIVKKNHSPGCSEVQPKGDMLQASG